MIVYHGTTARRARRICVEGFLPKKPSRRVWFAESRQYALGRARTQARRSHDSPAVFTCEIDLAETRKQLGGRKVFHKGGIIAITAHVPVTVLRSHPISDSPASPEELAQWVNHVLGMKPYRGVSRRHPGIDRLSLWVVNRMASRPNSAIGPRELLGMARRWLPEFFGDVDVDPESLRVRRSVQSIRVAVEAPVEPPDPREDEALDCLASPKPRRRARGIAMLADLGVPDLFDWCTMFVDDDSADVVVAALRTMLRCEDVQTEVAAPFADSEDRAIRAAATAVLAKHTGKDAPRWFARGLRDPDPCVRVETARQLSNLDPKEHHDIFELALYDPNPEVRSRAERLTAGKSYPRRW